MRSLLVIFIFLISHLGFSAWIQRADFGAKGRHRGTGIHIGNKGYIGLGHYNGAGPNIIKNDWWEYDPATNAWTQKANYPGGNGGLGAYGCLAFGMDKFGFVGGGQNASGPEFYRFDPSTNTWSPAASLPTNAMNTQGFVIDNIGYYISGSTVYAYNSTTNVWTIKNPAPFTNSVWNSSFVIDNKGYIKSGLSLYEYKPTIDQWAMRASFPGLATAGSVGFSQRNKGYIVTGYASWLSEVNSEVWEYDPAHNTWVQLDEFYGTSRRFAVGFEIGDRCYFGIGTNGTNFNDFWEFDAIASTDELSSLEYKFGPNPVSDYIEFFVNNDNGLWVEIIDMQGNSLVREFITDRILQLNRTMVLPGNYIMMIANENERSIQRITLI